MTRLWFVSVPQRHWTHTKPSAYPRKPPAATGKRQASGSQALRSPWAFQYSSVHVSRAPSHLCAPRDSNMQDPRERGGEPGQTLPLSWPPSDFAEEAGKDPPCQASEDSGASGAPGRHCGADAECVRTRPHLPPWDGEACTSGLSEGFATCAAGGLDAVEHSSAWGEFESFQESSAKSEQLLSQSFELQERAKAPQQPRTVFAQKDHSSQQPRQGGTVTVSPAEVFLKHSACALHAGERPADLSLWWAGQGLVGGCSCSGLPPRIRAGYPILLKWGTG